MVSDPGPRVWATMIHETLLWLAGQLPDDLIAMARQRLAAGMHGELARSIAFGVIGHRVPLRQADHDLLAELLAEQGISPSALAGVWLAGANPAPPFVFTSQLPDAADAPPGEVVERAAVDALAEEPEVRGLWLAWRSPAGQIPSPPPRRVFLVEADAGTNLAALAARLQSALHASGEDSPQVEVFAAGSELPSYQLSAMGNGVLLWARAAPPAATAGHLLPGRADAVRRNEFSGRAHRTECRTGG